MPSPQLAIARSHFPPAHYRSLIFPPSSLSLAHISPQLAIARSYFHNLLHPCRSLRAKGAQEDIGPARSVYALPPWSLRPSCSSLCSTLWVRLLWQAGGHRARAVGLRPPALVPPPSLHCQKKAFPPASNASATACAPGAGSARPKAGVPPSGGTMPLAVANTLPKVGGSLPAAVVASGLARRTF